MSWDCTFIDTDFHPLIDTTRQKPLKVSQAIKIGYGSWIGHNCIISKGVRLPHNTTVSSGSIVKGSFRQEDTILGGNLAVVLDEGYIRDVTKKLNQKIYNEEQYYLHLCIEVRSYLWT